MSNPDPNYDPENVLPEDIIVNGEWDGETIWRKKTSAEKLAEEIK